MEVAERLRREVELYERGLSLQAVAVELGYRDSSTVWRHLKKANVERRPLSRPLIDVARVVELYERGLSLQAVGDELGISHETVRYHLEKANVERRPPSAPRLPPQEPRECKREGCRREHVPLKSNVDRGRGEFCSGRCWARHRWRHGIGLQNLVDSYVSGRARRRWKNRWNGLRPAAAGNKRGRPVKKPQTPELAAQVKRLADLGRSDAAIVLATGLSRRKVRELRGRPI